MARFGSFKLFEIWYRRRVRVTKTNSAKNKKRRKKEFFRQLTSGVYIYIYVTVYRKTGHNAACVNIEKRSIDFLKMNRFKPTEGNGLL